MKIDIIGTGNVATHLQRAFQEKADVRVINSRTLNELRKDADIYLLSVSDDAIKEVSRKLKGKMNRTGILAHTSGSTPLSAIKGIAENFGVFYPLQTFSKSVELRYDEIPFFIEGNGKLAENKLIETARLVSRNVNVADSEKRRYLHIASVFCCNFTNHLWSLASDYLESHGMNFGMVLPLIKETMRKASVTPPKEAQTGPAVRKDHGVMEAHMRRLESEPELQDIYSLMSMSIMSHH